MRPLLVCFAARSVQRGRIVALGEFTEKLNGDFALGEFTEKLNGD